MNKRIPIFIGFLLLAFAIWIQLTSFPTIRHTLTRMEHLAYDLQLRTKLLKHKKLTESPVVIIDIDDKSISKEGRWPWPRSKIADLVTHLKKHGAVVIAFDILFTEKENNIAEMVAIEINNQSLLTPEIETLFKKIQPFFDHDSRLAESLKEIDVTLGMTFTPSPSTTGMLPPPLIILKTPLEKNLGFMVAAGYISDIPILQTSAKNAGFLNVFTDEDGIVRRVPLFIRYQDGLYPSLALEAVRLYLLSDVKLTTEIYGNSMRLEGIQLGNHIIPTDPKSQVVIPFFGKSFTLPFVSATDVLQDKIASGVLEGKIVFVGTSATSLGDLHATAIQGVFPGVEIQASIAYGILQDAFSYRPAWSLGAELFYTILLGLLGLFIFPYLGPLMLGILIVVIPSSLIFLNSLAAEKTGLIVSIIIPIILTVVLAMMNMLYGYLFETRRRERLKNMFGQYVPEKHIDEMLSHGGNYGLLGDDREMTVLFADIRGFTTISEPLTAAQLKELLNEFFTPMTEIIFRHRGTIDKYVGDLIMAFWGAPLKDKRHAQHALTAALDMQTTVLKLHKEFAARDWPEIHIGIGLNTGIMSVGDMGSKFRRNYTVLGDAVNLASRIEGLTKHYGVKILVSEHTQQNQKQFVFRQIDRVRVKGKKMHVTIFELMCRQTDLTDALKKEIQIWEEALQNYFNQAWPKAHELLTQLHETHPSSKLYHLYLERLKEFEMNPPPENWDGVYVHLTK